MGGGSGSSDRYGRVGECAGRRPPHTVTSVNSHSLSLLQLTLSLPSPSPLPQSPSPTLFTPLTSFRSFHIASPARYGTLHPAGGNPQGCHAAQRGNAHRCVRDGDEVETVKSARRKAKSKG